MRREFGYLWQASGTVDDLAPPLSGKYSVAKAISVSAGNPKRVLRPSRQAGISQARGRRASPASHFGRASQATSDLS